MSFPLVSVILPTFNRAWSLRRAIDSVLKQTLREFELIVVDDGSSDETGKILKEYKSDIRLISQENKGVSAARNAGIKIAAGEWIAFLDSDDEWMPHKLEAQIQFFKTHPEYKIAQTLEKWIRNGKFVNPPKTHQKLPDNIFLESLQKCMITASSVMIHKSLLDEVGLFNESLPACEDYDLWLRIVHRIPVGLIPETHLIRYGGHADQLSAKYFGNDRYRIRALIYMLDHCPLTALQKEQAIEELKRKCNVYGEGCKKRGKIEEAERFLKLPLAYQKTPGS